MIPIIPHPIAMALGINSLWLGVFYIINTEIGLMTPPVGLALFVLVKGIVKEDMATIARSTIPFIFMMLLTLLIMYFFPQIAT